VGPTALLALAEPLGRLLARVSAAAPLMTRGPILPEMRIDTRLVQADERLRMGAARERLGATLADDLRTRGSR
jgi:hypothetical protein